MSIIVKTNDANGFNEARIDRIEGNTVYGRLFIASREGGGFAAEWDRTTGILTRINDNGRLDHADQVCTSPYAKTSWAIDPAKFNALASIDWSKPIRVKEYPSRRVYVMTTTAIIEGHDDPVVLIFLDDSMWDRTPIARTQDNQPVTTKWGSTKGCALVFENVPEPETIVVTRVFNDGSTNMISQPNVKLTFKGNRLVDAAPIRD